ncbi:hypothetical protein K1719_025172 [Acacia pycnantha]|nr:hypothetical protein K1719_025172 [Acacia pycnantha]
MWFSKKMMFFIIFWFMASVGVHSLPPKRYEFVVKEASYTRLCCTKNILTVNGQIPGPTISVHKGETVYVDVYNKGRYNITLHWHGVKEPNNPWPDGPEYITQCPIQPGGKFRQKVVFSTEEGTLWWHAHSDWSRATVYGAIIVYPRRNYPFPKPHAQIPIIFGEWWKSDVRKVYKEFLKSGGSPNNSDAITINGQPGDLYPCSKSRTFKVNVDKGKTYLLRMVNAAMNLFLFVSVSNHKLTLVGTDGSYTRQLTRDYIVIAPGQTMDVLLHANQKPNHYYMAARAYSSGVGVPFDNTTATAIIQYSGKYNTTSSSSPSLPDLPYYNDTDAAFKFYSSIRGLPDKFPHIVPANYSTNIVTTLSINTFPCRKGQTCNGPNTTRLASSMNNISFVTPSIDILEAYYYHINGVFGWRFPTFPPLMFNFTADYLPLELEIPRKGTEVKVLRFGARVQVVFQGTNLVAGIDHPMHLHGFSFYVVGYGKGNFNEQMHTKDFNLIDPPLVNTVAVPKNGWAAVRFTATNPGVWFMHCHLDRHLSWGMETVFIVKNGKRSNQTLLPPPPDMPPC